MRKRLAFLLLGGLLALGCGRDQASNQNRGGGPSPGPGSTGNNVSPGGAVRGAPGAPDGANTNPGRSGPRMPEHKNDGSGSSR